MNRKKFLIQSGILSSALLTKKVNAQNLFTSENNNQTKPIVVSTWKHGLTASLKAMELIKSGENSLTAVEKGINIVEEDASITSVGLGGFPDADGNVTLDASIMDWRGNTGAVAYLQNIINPISVARKVMEDTKHVLLAGKGALEFAKSAGFKEQNLLTEKTKNKWLKWKRKKEELISPHLNHDTIGLLAIDNLGNISGGVSTSGWAFKLPGRIGDSPIIGAGLYVDNEVGGACSTGLGEEAIKSVGSFLIVEKMREGFSPSEACKYVIEHIDRKTTNKNKFQLAFLAINKNGEVGSYSLQPGFEYAKVVSENSVLIKSTSLKQ